LIAAIPTIFTPLPAPGTTSAARLGRITRGDLAVDTPALLVQTVGGSIPSMPPDLAASIDAAVVEELDWTTQAIGQQHTSPLRAEPGIATNRSVSVD